MGRARTKEKRERCTGAINPFDRFIGASILRPITGFALFSVDILLTSAIQVVHG